MKLKILIATLLTTVATTVQARTSAASSSDPAPSTPPLSYDVGAAVGNYNGAGYSEITLGLNWFLTNWLNWRNSAFFRSGGNLDSIIGVDSAFRFTGSTFSQTGSYGVTAFIGPGVRIATKNSNAVFGEGGVIFKVGGISLGGGVKLLNYLSDRQDLSGNTLARNDSQYFIILGGGGFL